jgi:lysophospholipase L1-like esterase
VRHGSLLVVFIALAMALAVGGLSTATAPASPRYIALGDSLAASMQPDANGHDRKTSDGYAERVWRSKKASAPGLRLVKLGRGGETAASMVKSPKPGPSQLEQAEDELQSGASVSLVTIDIGANEVERCRSGAAFDQHCVQQGLATLRQSLPRIIGRLRAAGGHHLNIVGINYYNSFLGQWVTGSAGRRVAQASIPVERAINATLAAIYKQAQVPLADVETEFATGALSRYVRTPAYGRVPLAVARTCRWTWACSSRYDDHTNSRGYRVIARTVTKLI